MLRLDPTPAEEDALVTQAAADRIRRRVAKARATWLAGIDAIPDPELRAQVAVAELAAVLPHLRGSRDQAFAALYVALGGEAGGGYAEVGRRVPNPATGKALSRPAARRHGMAAPAQDRAAS